MKTVEFNVRENLVYDAKTAGELVTYLSGVTSQACIGAGTARVTAKSIIGVISLALKPNDKIAVSANGSDADEAIEIVKKVLG